MPLLYMYILLPDIPTWISSALKSSFYVIIMIILSISLFKKRIKMIQTITSDQPIFSIFKQLRSPFLYYMHIMSRIPPSCFHTCIHTPNILKTFWTIQTNYTETGLYSPTLKHVMSQQSSNFLKHLHPFPFSYVNLQVTILSDCSKIHVQRSAGIF